MSEYEYLYEEYGYNREAVKYITSVEDIKEYFKEDWSSYLDYGQGWHDQDATILVFVEGRSFKVELEVDDMTTIWMGRGDKMHQIESIHDPVVSEIETPSPKKRFNCTFNVVDLTQDDINALVAKGFELSHKEDWNV